MKDNVFISLLESFFTRNFKFPEISIASMILPFLYL